MDGLGGLITVRADFDKNAVVILDQTQLPGKEEYIRLCTPEEIWEAIYHLKVRGAPAIGVAAAYGMAVCCRQFADSVFTTFYQHFLEVKSYLVSSRPTAVNLFMALERMEKCVLHFQG